MHKAKHGADASCSLPTVVAERTLPAAGLFRLDVRQGNPINRRFPSYVLAGRTRHYGFSATFKRVRTRCGAKASGDLEQVPWCRMKEYRANAGGPLIRASPEMCMRRWRWTSLVCSRSYHNDMHDTDTHTQKNEWTAEWMGGGRRLVDIPDRLAKGGVGRDVSTLPL